MAAGLSSPISTGMNLKIELIICGVILLACGREAPKAEPEAQVDYLLEAEELLAMVDRPHIKVIDFRRREEYDQEHLAGAVNIWRSDIEDSSYTYGGIMASPHQMESVLGRRGIGTKDTLVLYDDNGLCNASRLWWILQNYDFDHVRMLHGGLSAWTAAGGALSTEAPSVESTTFELTDKPSMKYYTSKEQMSRAIGGPAIIIDTRSADEYSGKRHKNGAAKGGRIPGSLHLDWAEAIDHGGDMRLKSLADLEQTFDRFSQSTEKPIILYCHTGVRSAHTTFVLTQLLGYDNVKNYDGSWTEWSHFDELPYEQDSITTI